ncbi:phage portal protein [Lacticaseibacillus saniviri]
MGVAIDRELAGNIENPSYEVLNYAIEQLTKSKDRFDKLFDYYNGKQSILDRNTVQMQTKTANVMINHAKYTTDMIVGFMTGNPISIAAGKGKDIQPVLDALDLMDINSHDAELEKDLSVFGTAYEVAYLSVGADVDGQAITVPRVEKIDPRGIVMVTDDTVEKTPLFAVHVLEKQDLQGNSKGYLITVYTSHWIIKYRTKNGSELSDGNLVRKPDVQAHYFGKVPVIEYRNNEERQGDFEQTIPLIDAYNLLQSDRLTDKENFVDAILVLYGFKLDDQANVGDGIIEAPAKGGMGDGGAAVEWLTKTFNETEINVLSQSLLDDIHKTTYVPNMNDKNFMGNVSGEAMKYKLFGLLQLLATKQRYLTHGIQQRLQLLQNILATKGQACDVSGATIQVVPNIPVNMSDTINNIKNASGYVPEQIALSWLPGPDSPDEMIAMLDEEKRKAAQRTAESMGTMSQSNYDDERGSESDDQSKNADEGQ